MPAIHCKGPDISVEVLEKLRKEVIALREELY